MVSHNNQLPNAHLHKDWQLRVKTWFDQPAKKKTRRIARSKKAAAIAPRPVDGLLRPAVRAPTLKYNTKVRAGRGFTLEELKAAGISRKAARSIGIAVDHRRRNRSAESLDTNVARLQEYKSKLIVFPRKAGKPKNGDSQVTKRNTFVYDFKSDGSIIYQVADVKAATQLDGPLFPITKAEPVLEYGKISGEQKAHAFLHLRRSRADAKLVGVRAARAKEAAESEKKDK
ncbi:ribosomal protein L13e-domain-containing protein [Cladochytrium replicatum]|nr:ribosomal protein L13e-domain-containing protein [Cladochytrium replicatum]